MCTGCNGRQRAALIVANKADLPAADAGIELLQAQIRNLSALHMRDNSRLQLKFLPFQDESFFLTDSMPMITLQKLLPPFENRHFLQHG